MCTTCIIYSQINNFGVIEKGVFSISRLLIKYDFPCDPFINILSVMNYSNSILCVKDPNCWSHDCFITNSNVTYTTPNPIVTSQ